MTTKQKVRLLHARHYFELLRAYESQLREDQVGILSRFEQYRGQFERGQSYARTYLEVDKEAAEICARYPIAGANILVRSLTPTQFLSWVEDAVLANQVAGDAEVAATLMHLQSISYMGRGEYEIGIESCREAISLADECGNTQVKQRALSNLAYASIQLGNYDDAIAAYETVLKMAEAGDYTVLQIIALNNLAGTHFYKADYAKAVDYAQQALELISDPLEQGRTLSNLAAYLVPLGRYDEALSKLNDALQMARQTNRVDLQRDCHSNLGGILLERGRFEDACDEYMRALELAKTDTESPKHEGMCWGNLGEVDFCQGHYPEAAVSFGKALTIARQVGDKRYVGIWLASLGKTAVEVDLLDQADRLLTRAENMLQSIDAKEELVLLILYQSLLYLLRHDLEAARRRADDALQLAQTIQHRPYMGKALLWCAEVARQQGELETALTSVQEAHELLREPGMVESLLARDMLALITGQREGKPIDLPLRALAEAELAQGKLVLAKCHLAEANRPTEPLEQQQHDAKEAVLRVIENAIRQENQETET